MKLGSVLILCFMLSSCLYVPIRVELPLGFFADLGPVYFYPDNREHQIIREFTWFYQRYKDCEIRNFKLSGIFENHRGRGAMEGVDVKLSLDIWDTARPDKVIPLVKEREIKKPEENARVRAIPITISSDEVAKLLSEGVASLTLRLKWITGGEAPNYSEGFFKNIKGEILLKKKVF